MPVTIPPDGTQMPSPSFFKPLAAGQIQPDIDVATQLCRLQNIDASQFRLYPGFGQQLGPIVMFGAAGAIDGLGAIFPKTVSKLFKLVSTRPMDNATLDDAKELQWKVSTAEEYVGKYGVLGIREAIFKVLGFGHLEGGRLPLRGQLNEGEFQSWGEILGEMAAVEKSL